MNKPRLMVFSGTVGSGKSTQIELLASELRKKGLNVKTTTIKTNHLFAHLLTFVLAHILIKDRKDVYPIRALIEEKPAIFRRMFKVWLVLDLLSISLRFLLKILLPIRMGYTVLVEEYIPATISDYIYLSRTVDFPLKTSSFATKFMLKLMFVGDPMQTIFLDAEVGALKTRWRNRKSLNETPDYLSTQRTTLLSLSRILASQRVLCINTTNQNIKQTHRLIVNYFEDGIHAMHANV